MAAAPPGFTPDAITREVMQLVRREYPDHPGDLDSFDWPVTPAQSQVLLDDFIEHRLPLFGTYQDAMWTGGPFLFHSLLSASLNLKLLDPRTVLQAAETSHVAGNVKLACAEGFVRQILGWRAYVRGIYHARMPDYTGLNALQASQPLPDFFWNGDTDMACLRETIDQTLRYGYANHSSA